MIISEQSIVGELVAENFKTASVFKKHHIDFCCNGNRTIAEACEKKHIDAEKLIQELNGLQSNNSENYNFNEWDLDLLADYIEKKHHRFVRNKIEEIEPFLYKVAKVHGERHPELLQIKVHFDASASELTHHMKKEEELLFPIIRKLINGEATETSVEDLISDMHEEHQNEGDRFRLISELSNDYTPPADACATYKVTFALLKEFEDDLHTHIHLENNILFPKAIALEQVYC